VDYRDLTNLLLKVAGAVIIIFAIINVPTYVSYYFALQEQSFIAFLGVSVIPMLVPAAVGLFLLLFPVTITNKIIKGEKGKKTPTMDILALERVAFSVLGLYLMFRVVSDLVYHGTSIYLAGGLATYNTGYQHPLALLITTIVEFFFALYLLLGSSGLIRLLDKFRTSGTK